MINIDYVKTICEFCENINKNYNEDSKFLVYYVLNQISFYITNPIDKFNYVNCIDRLITKKYENNIIPTKEDINKANIKILNFNDETKAYLTKINESFNIDEPIYNNIDKDLIYQMIYNIFLIRNIKINYYHDYFLSKLNNLNINNIDDIAISYKACEILDLIKYCTYNIDSYEDINDENNTNIITDNSISEYTDDSSNFDINNENNSISKYTDSKFNIINNENNSINECYNEFKIIVKGKINNACLQLFSLKGLKFLCQGLNFDLKNNTKKFEYIEILTSNIYDRTIITRNNINKECIIKKYNDNFEININGTLDENKLNIFSIKGLKFICDKKEIEINSKCKKKDYINLVLNKMKNSSSLVIKGEINQYNLNLFTLKGLRILAKSLDINYKLNKNEILLLLSKQN